MFTTTPRWRVTNDHTYSTVSKFHSRLPFAATTIPAAKFMQRHTVEWSEPDGGRSCAEATSSVKCAQLHHVRTEEPPFLPGQISLVVGTVCRLGGVQKSHNPIESTYQTDICFLVPASTIPYVKDGYGILYEGEKKRGIKNGIFSSHSETHWRMQI